MFKCEVDITIFGLIVGSFKCHILKSLEAGVGCKIGVGFKIESLPFWHFSCAKEGNFSLAKIFKKKILKPKTQDRLILNS